MTVESCCVQGCPCTECKAILAPIAERLQYQQKVLARIEEALAKLQAAATRLYQLYRHQLMEIFISPNK